MPPIFSKQPGSSSEADKFYGTIPIFSRSHPLVLVVAEESSQRLFIGTNGAFGWRVEFNSYCLLFPRRNSNNASASTMKLVISISKGFGHRENLLRSTCCFSCG